MIRGLVWACVGLVAVGFFLRLSGEKEPSPRPSRPTPTPAPSSSVLRETRERLLKDDALTPPPETASKDEQRAYRSIVDAIAKGRDPLAEEAAAVRDGQREALMKRMELRRRAADDRRKAQQAKTQSLHELKRQEHEEKRRANEGRVLPPPLLPPPAFGPPVEGVAEKDVPSRKP